MRKRKDSYEYFLRMLGKLMDRYEGQYVAIVGVSVVAHGKRADRVYEKARKIQPGKRVLIGQVPAREAMVLWVAHVSLSQDKDQTRSEQ